jgi:hypothetical protein
VGGRQSECAGGRERVSVGGGVCVEGREWESECGREGRGGGGREQEWERMSV